jgi:hypothetical protein
LVGRMNELIAALAGFSLLLEDAVHGANRAEVLAFVQQGARLPKFRVEWRLYYRRRVCV